MKFVVRQGKSIIAVEAASPLIICTGLVARLARVARKKSVVVSSVRNFRKDMKLCSVSMSDVEVLAWWRVCMDMRGGLHQYDYWDEVPPRVKEHYLQLIADEKEQLPS